MRKAQWEWELAAKKSFPDICTFNLATLEKLSILQKITKAKVYDDDDDKV